MAEILQVAEQDRGPEPLGEPAELLVDDRPEAVEVGPARLRLDDRGRLGASSLVDAPPYRGRAGATGDAERDAVQPAREGVAASERLGPGDEDEERRLEGVVGVIGVGQDPPADPVNHRPVPLDDRGEGQLGELAVAGQESLEELVVGQPGHRPDVEERAEVTAGGLRSILRHRCLPPWKAPRPRQ